MTAGYQVLSQFTMNAPVYANREYTPESGGPQRVYDSYPRDSLIYTTLF